MRQRGMFTVDGWGSFQAIWEENCLLHLQLTENVLPAFAAAELARTEAEPFLAEVEAQIRAYLTGRSRRIELPYRLPTEPPFQAQVLRAACEIPYGRVLSYGGLAAKAGRPRAARAAGSAMANTTLSLIVPCHRVIASGQRLGSFGGRPDLKRRLLALEGVEVTAEGRVLVPEW